MKWEKRTELGQHAAIKALLAAMSLTLLGLLFRNSGIYPVVFADEWSYSSFSRLISFDKVPVPSYLYFLTFRSTSFCGDDFLGCARILNSILFVASAPFIYLTAKRVSSASAAIVVAITSIAGAANIYTAFFMPEAMYFFVFWVLTWVATSLTRLSPALFGALMGGLLGLLALVKIHALFLVPAYCLYALYVSYISQQHRPRWQHASSLLLCTIASLILVKFPVGYALAGRSGLTWFGHLYGTQADGVVSTNNRLSIVIQSLMNLEGHLMGLALIFGLPCAALASRLLSARRVPVDDSDKKLELVGVYAFLILISMLTITVGFTASVAGTGPYESINRLHVRYYDFVLPLLYVVAAAQIERTEPRTRFRVVLAIVVGSFTIYSLLFLLARFAPSMVDSAELRGITYDPIVFTALGVASAALTFLWAFKGRLAAQLFIFVFLPLTAAFSSFYVSGEVRARSKPDVYDRAALFARQYLADDVAKLMVVGPDYAALLRTLFHLSNPSVKTLQLPPESTVDTSTLQPGVEWLLLVGAYAVTPTPDFRLSHSQFSLVKATNVREVDFRRKSWPGILLSARGVAEPESWGAWSNAKRVELEFATALPKHLQVTLDGYSFGSNAQRPFQLTVGNERRTFLLPASPSQVELRFETNGSERTLLIEIPAPTSPHSIGLGDDTRMLGVALSNLKIENVGTK